MTGPESYSFQPDYASPPGETLRQVLADLDLTQIDLANRAGLSTKHVNQIIKGSAPISTDTALTLERVTGVPAGFWNRLEARYRENVLRTNPAEMSEAEAAWLASLPLKSLEKRGHLPAVTDRRFLRDAAFAFFGVADMTAWLRIWQQPVASFKRTKSFQSDPGSVAAWLRIGELAARSRAVQPFSKENFRHALTEARSLSRQADFLQPLQELCAEAGVIVLYVPELEGCRASGAAWWLSPAKAVIQLSDRYKSDDHFWFSFFHEAAHILMHSKKETFIDHGSEDDALEDEANRFASMTLLSQRERQQLPSLKSTNQVKQFARSVGVSDGIVVGQLQHLKLWDWKQGRDLKRTVSFEDSDCVSV